MKVGRLRTQQGSNQQSSDTNLAPYLTEQLFTNSDAITVNKPLYKKLFNEESTQCEEDIDFPHR